MYGTHQKTLRFAIQYYLNQKRKAVSNSDSGFTLIELLVVIIIIGILSAIALPSFLNQASKGRQSEAKISVSAVARAEQAYYLENSAFVTDVKEIGKLGIGLPGTTVNYKYSLSPIGTAPDIKGVAIIAKPNGNNSIKGYISAVGLIYADGANDLSTITTMCESKDVGTSAAGISADDVTLTQGVAVTGGGSLACGSTLLAVK